MNSIAISKISDAAMPVLSACKAVEGDEIGQIPPLVEKMGDSKMASISGPNALEDSYTISCMHFGPIWPSLIVQARSIMGFQLERESGSQRQLDLDSRFRPFQPETIKVWPFWLLCRHAPGMACSSPLSRAINRS